MPEEILLTFPATRAAIAGERALLAAGLSVKVMPMPEILSAQCGIVLRLPPEELEAGREILQAAEVVIAAAYRKAGDDLLDISDLLC